MSLTSICITNSYKQRYHTSESSKQDLIHENNNLSNCTPEDAINKASDPSTTWQLSVRVRMWCRTQQKRRISLADTASPLVHSIHRHVHKHTKQKMRQWPQLLQCFPPSSLLFSLLWFSCVTVEIVAQFLGDRNSWHCRGGPTLQWRHGHREGRVRGMVPVKFLPLVFTRNSALEMCLYIEKALGKRQLFQTCHGSCHHILRSSLLTSAQMLSLGFMVQCGHLAVLLIPAGRRKKAIAGLHFQQLTFSLNSVSVQVVSKGKKLPGHIALFQNRKKECTTRDEQLTSTS